MIPLRLRPLADSDISAAAAFYASAAGADIGIEFLRSVARSLERIQEHPLIGTQTRVSGEHLGEFRCCPVSGFARHLVCYVPKGTWIDVARVLHASRDAEALLLNQVSFAE